MVYLLLLIGFIFLMKGADFFVEGSSSLAKRFHVPPLIIGMTIVAMGTSLPEAAVSITASLAKNNELAIANAIGSNIFNLLVVAGACALFTPLAVHKKTLKSEFPFSVGVAALLLGLGYAGSSLARLDGVMLLAVFCGFLIWMIRSSIHAQKNDTETMEDEIKICSLQKSMLFILAGGAGIAFGGNLVVDSATTIAEMFGLSQNLIGLTIVAIGTSLPELVTSMVAAKKGEVDMAMGNIIGSNIFNILFVLGMAASISPIVFMQENLIDIGLLIGFSAVIWCFAWTNKKIHRLEGVVMLGLYFSYMGYVILR